MWCYKPSSDFLVSWSKVSLTTVPGRGTAVVGVDVVVALVEIVCRGNDIGAPAFCNGLEHVRLLIVYDEDDVNM